MSSMIFIAGIDRANLQTESCGKQGEAVPNVNGLIYNYGLKSNIREQYSLPKRWLTDVQYTFVT